MNRVVLVGRLTKDLELTKTQTDKSVVKFTLAVDKFGDGADFINCVAWNKSAEFLSQYAKKGNMVGVDGRISTRSYDDKDGRKVYVTEVVAEQVNLLESRKVESVSKEEVPSKENNYGYHGPVDDDSPF